jgi:hypothetical protein
LKTLGEIAVEANLITKQAAAKAGRIADEKKQPLVVVLVREQRVDELALVAAIRKQTRVPLIDVAGVRVDPEAVRAVSKDVCARLRVLPISITTDHAAKVLRVAMADPTDTTAIAELEHVSQCEIEVSAMPLSAIEELVERSYKGLTTAVTGRGGRMTKPRRAVSGGVERESEISVTAQIPLSSLRDIARDDVELRLSALVQLLMSKGLFTEEELADAIRKLGV